MLSGDMALALIDRLPEPLIAVNPSSHVAFLNRAAQELIGSDATGRPLSSAVRQPRILDAVSAALGGEETQIIEFTEPVPVERHYSVTVSRVENLASDAQQPALAVLILFHDITSIKRSEQMRADFVANASHELKTPLASLQGFLETLRGPARDDPEAQQRFLSIMEEQAHRMGNLVDDLLSLSKIELKEHMPPSESVILLDVINDVADSLAPLAEEAGATLDITAEEDLPHIKGDREELRYLVQNLVGNAINYGGTGKKIDIALTLRTDPSGGDQLCLAVRDYGAGIDPQHLPRLTERFYRINVADSRARGGTGLGLAIVKHVANRHKGTLQIDSKPGEGSTFRVCLPISNAITRQ